VKYEDVTRLLEGTESKWNRQSKSPSGNLKNINEIANHFEVPLRKYFRAVVRKIGPDGKFIFAGGEARTGLCGHVFVHGDVDIDLTLSSCIRREGFGWSVELSEKKFLSGVTHVGYSWENSLVIVDVETLRKRGIPHSTRDGNVKFDLKTVSDLGLITAAMKVDGQFLVTPFAVMKMSERPNCQFQEFSLKGRYNTQDVIVVDLETQGVKTFFGKKALWNTMKKNGYSKTYENFRIMINRESERLVTGRPSQRPAVITHLGSPCMVFNSDVDPGLIDDYLTKVGGKVGKVQLA